MAVQEKYQFLTAQQVPYQYSLTEPEYSTDMGHDLKKISTVPHDF